MERLPRDAQTTLAALPAEGGRGRLTRPPRPSRRD
jgi:hypothetical protein